jgi:hypothetical protein
MTPVDIKIKEYMRQFFNNRMQAEKNNTAQMATGFVIRQMDIEKFLDDMWVFINRKLLEDQKNAQG